METKSKMMKVLAVGLLFLVVGFFSSEAYSWGFATHTYINDHLGKTKRNQNMDEIYGAVAPDAFEYLFNFPSYLSFLSDQTHTEFMKVWDVPKAGLGKSLAFGFASHNDVWGADSTAHHSGRTFGQNEGYIIAKAIMLGEILKQVPDYAALGLPDPVTLEISHELLENGVDLLIKRMDPSIGQKLSSSAMFRTSDFPVLLVKAYARDFSQFAGISYHEASKLIISAEKEFRKSIALYGQALTQDEATAIQLISEGTADIAAGFLASNGIELPPGVDIAPLIAFAIGQSIELCADDFAEEIAATIDFVNQERQSLRWFAQRQLTD